jgi:uncharacterized membrane protein YeaQ/YmgE (transglycosylase-associated protein family)
VYLSNEGVVMILLVGLIAGWLAGKIVRGAGIGLIGDMAIGIVRHRWQHVYAKW